MTANDNIQLIASLIVIGVAGYQTYLFYQMYQIMKWFKLTH